MSQRYSSVNANLSANGAATETVSMLNPIVTAMVTGTFVGTAALQARPTGSGAAWITLGSPLTAPGAVSTTMAGDVEFRIACTAYTSGTIAAYLAVAPTP